MARIFVVAGLGLWRAAAWAANHGKRVNGIVLYGALPALAAAAGGLALTPGYP